MHQINSDITASVWKVLVKEGDQVEVGAEVAILESMKMEIPVEADIAGTVATVHVVEGQSIDEGDPVVTLA